MRRGSDKRSSRSSQTWAPPPHRRFLFFGISRLENAGLYSAEPPPVLIFQDIQIRMCLDKARDRRQVTARRTGGVGGVDLQPADPGLSRSVRDILGAQVRRGLVMVQVASAPVHDERGDFTRIGKDHVGTVAHHASSDQSRRALFGTVATCVSL